MAQTKINCLNCNAETYVENKEIKRGYGKFCSIKCSSEFNGRNRIKPTNFNCAWCNKPIYKNLSKQKRSKSGLYFCDKKCKDTAQALNGLDYFNLPHYGTGQRSYREIAFRTKDKICERCSYDKNEAAIIVHHKDRNRDNNHISNLEVLCANCHLIEHYSETDRS